MRVCFPRQFAVHLLETLECIRYAIGHFETVTESAINRESRGCKLQTNGVPSQRGAPQQKEILTLTAPTKASLHEPPANFDLAHSLKSGVGDGGWRIMSALLSAVERHRCEKSVAKSRMHNGGTG